MVYENQDLQLQVQNTLKKNAQKAQRFHELNISLQNQLAIKKQLELDLNTLKMNLGSKTNEQFKAENMIEQTIFALKNKIQQQLSVNQQQSFEINKRHELEFQQFNSQILANFNFKKNNFFQIIRQFHLTRDSYNNFREDMLRMRMDMDDNLRRIQSIKYLSNQDSFHQVIQTLKLKIQELTDQKEMLEKKKDDINREFNILNNQHYQSINKNLKELDINKSQTNINHSQISKCNIELSGNHVTLMLINDNAYQLQQELKFHKNIFATMHQNQNDHLNHLQMVHSEERSSWSSITDVQHQRILDLEKKIQSKIHENNRIKNKYQCLQAQIQNQLENLSQSILNQVRFQNHLLNPRPILIQQIQQYPQAIQNQNLIFLGPAQQ